MEGGRGKKWQAKMRKQADRDTGRGLEGWGENWRGDTPADDRLMNLWIKSASAVLWTAADNNEMSGRAKWKWRTAEFGPARKFERGMEGTEVSKCEQSKKVRAEEKEERSRGATATGSRLRCQRSICLLERFRSAAPKLPSRGFHSLCVCVCVRARS